MPEFEVTAPGGRTFRVSAPEGTTAEQALERVKAQSGQETAEAPAAAPPTAAPAMTRTPYGLPAIPDPLSVAGKGLSVLRAPLKAAFDLAGRADVATGIKTPERAARRAETYANIPIPMAVGALTGGASVPAQIASRGIPAIANGLIGQGIIQAGTTAAMQEGGLEPKSPGAVAVSGSLPFGMGILGRLARGTPRSATRLIPGQFRGAQQAAQEGAEGVAQSVGPTSVAGDLHKAARQAGTEKVPAVALKTMLDDLDQTIPQDPTSPALKTAREFMSAAKGVIKGDHIDLGDLMRLRIDMGQSVGRSPQVAALYKAVLGDLEQAVGAGGPGANLAMKALEMGRREHGADLWRDLVAQASKRRSNLTGDLPLLDMAQLNKLVQNNKEDLIKRLGPAGYGQIEEFLVKNRALPPVDAYNFANKMALGGAGAAGFFGGGILPAIGTAGLYELLNNAKAVGQNPAELNRFLIMLGAGTQAGLTGAARGAVESKR